MESGADRSATPVVQAPMVAGSRRLVRGFGQRGGTRDGAPRDHEDAECAFLEAKLRRHELGPSSVGGGESLERAGWMRSCLRGPACTLPAGAIQHGGAASHRELECGQVTYRTGGVPAKGCASELPLVIASAHRGTPVIAQATSMRS